MDGISSLDECERDLLQHVGNVKTSRGAAHVLVSLRLQLACHHPFLEWCTRPSCHTLLRPPLLCPQHPESGQNLLAIQL